MPASAGSTSDVLEGGATSGQGVRALGLLVVLLLVAGLAAWLEGVRRQPGEAAALDACAAMADEAVGRAEARLALAAGHIAPVLGTHTARVDRVLLDLVARESPAVQGSVDDALHTCRGVDVWPLNDDHRQARAAQVELLAAEQQRLDAVAQDGRAYYRGRDAIDVLREEASDVRP